MSLAYCLFKCTEQFSIISQSPPSIRLLSSSILTVLCGMIIHTGRRTMLFRWISGLGAIGANKICKSPTSSTLQIHHIPQTNVLLNIVPQWQTVSMTTSNLHIQQLFPSIQRNKLPFPLRRNQSHCSSDSSNGQQLVGPDGYLKSPSVVGTWCVAVIFYLHSNNTVQQLI